MDTNKQTDTQTDKSNLYIDAGFSFLGAKYTAMTGQLRGWIKECCLKRRITFDNEQWQDEKINNNSLSVEGREGWITGFCLVKGCMSGRKDELLDFERMKGQNNERIKG